MFLRLESAGRRLQRVGDLTSRRRMLGLTTSFIVLAVALPKKITSYVNNESGEIDQ